MNQHIFVNILVIGFFVSVVVMFIAAMIDAQKLSVSWGGPTWKQWWRELFSWNTMKNNLPEGEKVCIEILIDESSSGRLSSHLPYSGSEWDGSECSSSAPSQTEGSSSDQASSCNAAASS